MCVAFPRKNIGTAAPCHKVLTNHAVVVYYTACDCLLGFKEVNMINSPTKRRAESPTLQTLNSTGPTRPRHKHRSDSPQDPKPFLRKCTLLTTCALHFGACPFTRGAIGKFCRRTRGRPRAPLWRVLLPLGSCLVCARLIYGRCIRNERGGHKASDILSRINEARFIIERTLARTLPLL